MYSTGQLAIILKVSARTLRYYDDIGLLKPCYINEESGYRYYEKEQIGLAKRIIKLKENGLSLDEIKEILSNNDESQNALVIKKRLAKIESEITSLLSMKNNLFRMLKENRITENGNQVNENYKVEVVELDAVNVISKRCRINLKDIGTVVGSLYEEINRSGLKIKGAHLIRYFENEYDPENADVEVCIPIESRKEGKLKISTIPEGKYATASADSISGKGDAHESIINWIESSSYKIIGHPIEQYNVNYQTGLFKIDIFYPIS